jgi:transcriptional regulator with XRE-family HTH domain
MPKLKWFEDPKIFRAKRKRLGLTQTQLAKTAKVDRAIIANIEAGRRPLTGDVADILWKTLTRTSYEQRKLEAREAKRQARLFGVPLTGSLSEMSMPNSRKIVTRIAKNALRVEQERDQLKARVSRLENLKGIDDPVIAEVIESYRREIETLEKQLTEKTPVTPSAEEGAD